MKKLTAGIFAGILTIVTVNAADAAITSKAYVDNKFAEKTALATTNENVTNLTTTVNNNKTAADNAIAGLTTVVGADANSGLQKKVADLQASVGEGGSVAGQIADALGDGLGTGDGDQTVKAALDAKQDKSASTVATAGNYIEAGNAVATNLGKLDTQVKANENAISAINNETTGILATSKAYTDDLAGGAVKDNADAISAMGTKIGTLPEGQTSVVTYIDSVKTSATTGVDTKLEDYSTTEQMNTALDKKANTNTAVAGNMITTDATGQITALNPTESEAGTYVLTATVANGKTTYYWENITGRGETTPAE